MRTNSRLCAVAACAAAGALLTAAPAHSGPTVATDLNLGTPLGVRLGDGPLIGETGRPALGVIGIALRAGWCFDVGRYLFLLPELGIEYDAERLEDGDSGHVSRFFLGGRIGISASVHPVLRLEPALFTHAGVGWYAIGVDAPTIDAGLALGLRIKERLLAGAQLGYTTVALRGERDQWLSYGLHAGARFW
jgi:hypothetical protein